MLCLTLCASVIPLASASGPVELNPHLRAVYARQDGPDTGEFIEFQEYTAGAGPLVVMIDKDGILAAVWDLSGYTPTDLTIVIGGPAVWSRDVDLSSGVGPAITGTEDFLPDETLTIRSFLPSPVFTTYVLGLVGTDIDPDGDGVTLLDDPAAPWHNSSLGSMALVDSSWPQASRVYDCAPIVGPDGADIPAGAVSNTAFSGPCLDSWLLPDGSNVRPGASELTVPCFEDFSGIVNCNEGLVGTLFCSTSTPGFWSPTVAWGSPILADQNLILGAPFTHALHIHLASMGRRRSALPGIPEPLCLAAPWFRVPGTYVCPNGCRFEVDFGALAGAIPVVAGVPMCFQTWTRNTGGGGQPPHLTQPLAVTLR
ncbi:MAG: hypothetical protein DRJ50_10405 [Actinobacteria bacterium]|nr:MAG: hypothetical protein DRJ50_10405 [Actinomycetota bacterium]